MGRERVRDRERDRDREREGELVHKTECNEGEREKKEKRYKGILWGRFWEEEREGERERDQEKPRVQQTDGVREEMSQRGTR